MNRMESTEELSRLIGDIYDTTLDPSAWPSVLKDTALFVRGSGAALFSKDAGSKSGNIHYDDGVMDSVYKQLYFEKYVKFDPATNGHYFAGICEPVATGDLMPYGEFLQSRFYREWVQPQGLVDFVSAVLEKSATSIAMFGVFRSERDGIVDDDTRRRMRLIVPHIRRAVLIAKVIDLKTEQAATFADTLDGLSAGFFLIDSDGRIMHANAAAHALLLAGDPVRALDGRLIATGPEANRALSEIFVAAGRGDEAVGLNGIAVPLGAPGGEHYVAHALPLTSGKRRIAGASYSAVAALCIHRAALQTPSAPEVIAKAFRLTPTELRVLLAIIEVGGVPEVAMALGVAESTVKTHLGRLYEKTGARRHADLVKITSRFFNPIVA
jgi:DNA-binding CsgD family transcriptional regulator/PAS domain-containing protein